MTRMHRLVVALGLIIALTWGVSASDTTMNRFLARGTTAQRLAFTPSAPTPASGPLQGYFWYDSDLQAVYAYDFGSGTWVAPSGSGTVTHTGTLTSGALVKGTGGVDITTATTGTGVMTALGTNTGTAGAFVVNGGALGTPSSGTATNLTGTASGLTAGTASAVAVGGITGLGSNVATALGIAVGSAGGPVTNGGALGTPSSGTLTNATALPCASGITNALGCWIEEKTPSGTGTLTFSSLGSFTHLEIRWMARSTTSALSADVLLQFNGDTTSVYDTELVYNSAATTAAAFEQLAGSSIIAGTLSAGTATAGRAGSGVIQINDYRGTTFDKVIVSTNHYAVAATGSSLNTRLFGGTWRNTAAVTSVTLVLTAGNYVAGSKFTLYGLY